MLRNLLCTLLLLAVVNIAQAQTPKYKCSRWDSIAQYVGKGFTGISVKYQCIYYPTNFPGMPKGTVTAIYIRVGGNPQNTSLASYPFFTAKIGYTADSFFHNGAVWDTFKTGLTTLYGPATFNVSGTDSIGRWVRIPAAGGWNYNAEGKFVFEIAMGPKPNNTGFDIMSTNRGTIFKNRTIGAHRDSVRTFGSQFVDFMDLGFDLTTTGVAGLSNITSFGLFPNPASNGRFNVSFDALQAVNDVSVTVTNVTGQQVYRRQYEGAGSSFFKEVDMGAVARGVYFAEVVADGERIVRRVVVD